MSEGWLLAEKLILVAIGFTVCLLVMLLIQAHDRKLERKIWVLEWENAHIKEKYDELRLSISKGEYEAPKPIDEPTKPVKAENSRSGAFYPKPINITSAMTQKELGVLQASLDKNGKFRGVWNGEAKVWM